MESSYPSQPTPLSRNDTFMTLSSRLQAVPQITFSDFREAHHRYRVTALDDKSFPLTWFGMIRQPARALGSYNSVPRAAGTFGTKSSGGLYRPELSPCTYSSFMSPFPTFMIYEYRDSFVSLCRFSSKLTVMKLSCCDNSRRSPHRPSLLPALLL